MLLPPIFKYPLRSVAGACTTPSKFAAADTIITSSYSSLVRGLKISLNMLVSWRDIPAPCLLPNSTPLTKSFSGPYIYVDGETILLFLCAHLLPMSLIPRCSISPSASFRTVAPISLRVILNTRSTFPSCVLATTFTVEPSISMGSMENACVPDFSKSFSISFIARAFRRIMSSGL